MKTLISEIQNAQIPLDVAYADIDYMDRYQDFTIGEVLFLFDLLFPILSLLLSNVQKEYLLNILEDFVDILTKLFSSIILHLLNKFPFNFYSFNKKFLPKIEKKKKTFSVPCSCLFFFNYSSLTLVAFR